MTPRPPRDIPASPVCNAVDLDEVGRGRGGGGGGGRIGRREWCWKRSICDLGSGPRSSKALYSPPFNPWAGGALLLRLVETAGWVREEEWEQEWEAEVPNYLDKAAKK